MSEQTEVSFDAALMMALRADAQKELDELPTPAQLKERYPDTSRWDARLQAALHKRRPVLIGNSTVNGSIYQTYYQVDAQTRTGIKSISVSGTLYEKGTFGTWQRVSNCSNTSTTSNCMASSNYNTKPGKSYKLEYSATFNYSDGRSETITSTTTH